MNNTLKTSLNERKKKVITEKLKQVNLNVYKTVGMTTENY